MAGFLVYMTPAAFIVTWELAKYFFGDKLMIKVLESISISFYALAFIFGIVLAANTFGNFMSGFAVDKLNVSININYKLMICIPVYIALGILFSRIARKIAIKNDEKNDEDDRGEKIRQNRTLIIHYIVLTLSSNFRLRDSPLKISLKKTRTLLKMSILTSLSLSITHIQRTEYG